MMKIRSLDIGLEGITRWQADDEVHLPREGSVSPTFLPVERPLDAVLRRPSLDERLPALMQPEAIDPDLLQPAALSAARKAALQRFRTAAGRHMGGKQALFQAAANLLEDEAALDEAVYDALSALMKG